MEKELELVKQVAKKVKDAGGIMYFVGGFVRDHLLGKESKDIDVEIHGITESKLVEILKSFGQVDLVGESFGVYLIKGVDIDFAMPRQERKIGEKHTDFDVTVDPFIGTYEASKRRDFTMNAIMQDVLTGDVTDHFGGVDDIRNRVIKLVDKTTFQEDALRVLRAIQFSARFGFEIDKETESVMKEMDLTFLPKERVYMEIEKGMTKGYPSVFISQLKRFETVSVILPTLEKASLGFMDKKNDLSVNTALMGLEMTNREFEIFVNEFIQNKQGRKKAILTRSLLLESKHSTSAHAMALTIARYRNFIDSDVESVSRMMTSFLKKEELAMFQRILSYKEQTNFVLDGNWLQQLGIQPSPQFKVLLDEAHALSFMGFSEEQIKNRILL